jgi:hypothetical protein
LRFLPHSGYYPQLAPGFVQELKLILFALCLIIAPKLLVGENWINLFNGKDLSGWTQKTGDARFYAQDGCIIGEAVSESETN